MNEHSELATARLLDRLDGSGSDDEWVAVRELRSSLGDSLPKYLLDRFCTAKKWVERSSYVFHATRYARRSREAIALGKLAVRDKSKVVRYRGCMLLAYSLDRNLLPELERLLGSSQADSRADIAAALDAIEQQNENYFVDRDHSGQLTLIVQ